MTPEIFPKCLHHNCNDLIRINASISLDRWRQNHAKSVQNHGTVIAMNEEVPLVTEPQPRLNSWTLNKGWIIIGTAWCTTIHHYSDMKPFIGHNRRDTHLVLVLLGTQQLWEKLNHQKSLDFLHLKNPNCNMEEKMLWILGNVRLCQTLNWTIKKNTNLTQQISDLI